MKKAGRIIMDSILIVLVVIAMTILVPNIFGIKTLAVLSGSMEPTYPVGSMVFVVPTDPENIEVDDAISFTVSQDTVVTHRVAEVDRENKQFVTKGDANDANDPSPVIYQNVIGVVRFHLPIVGRILGFVLTKQGKIVAGTVIVAAIIMVLLSGDEKGSAEEEETGNGKKKKKKQRPVKEKKPKQDAASKSGKGAKKQPQQAGNTQAPVGHGDHPVRGQAAYPPTPRQQQGSYPINGGAQPQAGQPQAPLYAAPVAQEKPAQPPRMDVPGAVAPSKQPVQPSYPVAPSKQPVQPSYPVAPSEPDTAKEAKKKKVYSRNERYVPRHPGGGA